MNLTWADVFATAQQFPHKKALIYGIPRGGAVVAGMLQAHGLGTVVAQPEDAQVIVDDIIDSGTTRDRYLAKYPGKGFWALVDRHADDKDTGWITFPWEGEPLREEGDIIVRLLELMGEDPRRPGLKDTPGRVLRSLAEMTAGYKMDPAKILERTFPDNYDQMVVVRGIEFWSLCEHHMLPFHGTATVGYIPSGGKVVGLSKLARLVHCYARRLQVQERLTNEIAEAIQKHLAPVGVGVVVRASHLCMAARGVRTPAEMVTSCMMGAMREDPEARAELLDLDRGARRG